MHNFSDINNYALVLFAGIFVFLSVLILFFKRQSRKHRYNQKKSKQILQKINSFEFEGQKIQYLRKINPFVFEELLLEAFLKKGYKIERNHRYTGDNGIDGIVYKNGVKYLIQAKRYKEHINLKHLKDFAFVVHKNNCKGIFCHTGKTGKASKELGANIDAISIISGQKLIELLK